MGVPIAAQRASYFESVSLDELDRTLSVLARALAVGAAVATAAGSALGLYASRRVLRPLGEVAETAAGITAGNLSARLAGASDPDLGRGCARRHRLTLAVLAEGKAVMVFVEGEAGIGKSRLLDAVIEQAGMRACVGRGDELQVRRPFGILAEAFGCRRGSADPARAEAAQAIAGGASEQAILDAFAELVESTAPQAPSLCVFDDLPRTTGLENGQRVTDRRLGASRGSSPQASLSDLLGGACVGRVADLAGCASASIHQSADADRFGLNVSVLVAHSGVGRGQVTTPDRPPFIGQIRWVRRSTHPPPS